MQEVQERSRVQKAPQGFQEFNAVRDSPEMLGGLLELLAPLNFSKLVRRSNHLNVPNP